MAAKRLTALEQSAFWIFSVTGLVLREPMGAVISHAARMGLGNWQVQLEFLRSLVILILVSRLFLMSGLFLEKVYMQPDSSDRFPRRSYPIDFLVGIFQFLLVVASSTAVTLDLRPGGWYSPFSIMIAIFLLFDLFWLAITALRRFSTTDLVAREVLVNVMLLVTSGVIASTGRLAGLDAVFCEKVGLIVLALLAAGHMAFQIVGYEDLA